MTNEQLVHTWFDRVWNQKDENAIDECFHSAGIANGLVDENGQVLKGPEPFKVFFRKFIGSFPDIHVEVEKTISQDNYIASLLTVTATHTGQPFEFLPGKYVDVQSDPVKIQFTGTTFSYLENDKIIEAWNHFDFLTMFLQMGVKFDIAVMEHS